MKIAFLGTPEFAVPSLKMLISEGHDIEVFTQPDRPRDRGHALAMPPVKSVALEAGLRVHQFEKIRSDEGLAALRAAKPELMVTAAFGQLLSAENLAAAKYGCINVHGSLLPKYRGASPIQSAIMNGERITGVTTMQTALGMDTGDILLKKSVEIGEDETCGELYSRLSLIGAELLCETIAALLTGSLSPTPQLDAEATHCRPIKKQDALIDFNIATEKIHDLVRALNPAPVAFMRLGDQSVKVYKTKKLDPNGVFSGIELASFGGAMPGECVIAGPKQGLVIKTGDGFIEIDELQFPNSKRMSAKTALNGKKLLGAVFA